MRTCRDCGVSKDLDEFYVVDKTTGRRRGSCKGCHQDKVRKYHADHPEDIRKYQGWYRGQKQSDNRCYQKAYYREKADEYRNRWLVAKYGITLEEYTIMLDNQAGGCAVCGALEAGGNSPTLYVDHCHYTGKVRGLLCHGCNTAIGLVKDSSEIAARISDYLLHQ